MEWPFYFPFFLNFLFFIIEIQYPLLQLFYNYGKISLTQPCLSFTLLEIQFYHAYKHIAKTGKLVLYFCQNGLLD